MCGGGKSTSSQRSCLHISTLLTPGSRRNIQLSQRRRDHLCWKMPGGDDEVLLLGGTYSPSSTEVVKGTKSSSSFRLQDKTEKACGMEVRGNFIVTGGKLRSGSLNKVAEYSKSGFVRYLPDLNQRRFWHACSSYRNNDDKTVLLVTGGGYYSGRSFNRLDSTELLVDFTGPWQTPHSASLPTVRAGLAAATLDNTVFIFGGKAGGKYNSVIQDSIHSFNPTLNSWEPAGNMIEGRDMLSVGIFENVANHCA